MKPTTAEQEFLKKHLRKNVMFRETYIEFYDHILSALEAKPGNVSFQDAVENIIKEDFGGYEGIDTIEKRYKKAVFKEIQKKYWEYVVAYFKFPQVRGTAILILLLYWVTKQPWFSFWVFIGIFFAMRMTPAILRRARNIFSGYIFTNPQTSVKDGGFKWLDYISVTLFALFITCGAVYGYSPIGWFKNVHPAVIAILLVLCALNTLAYYKVYKGEFKTSITQ